MTKPAAGRSRLGRGLNSLLSLTETHVKVDVPDHAVRSGESLAGLSPRDIIDSQQSPTGDDPGPISENSSPWQMLSLSEIVANPHQPRQIFSDQSLADLAASLKANGMIQPIIVRAAPEGYELVAGERRLRAARLAGFATIPAIVRDVDPYTQAQLALVENIQREDLNPLDRAKAYETLMIQLGLTQAELAGRLGEHRSSVANFLRLLELSEPVRQLLRAGELSLGHAKVLAGVADKAEQERLASVCVSQQLSVRNLERLIESPTDDQKTDTRPTEPSAHLRDLEQRLTREIGLRVQVRAGGNKKKGRLVIHYASLEQFDDLMKRLNVSVNEEQ